MKYFRWFGAIRGYCPTFLPNFGRRALDAARRQETVSSFSVWINVASNLPLLKKKTNPIPLRRCPDWWNSRSPSRKRWKDARQVRAATKWEECSDDWQEMEEGITETERKKEAQTATRWRPVIVPLFFFKFFLLLIPSVVSFLHRLSDH